MSLRVPQQLLPFFFIVTLSHSQAFITRGNILMSGTLMTVNGSLAAAAAYL